MMRTGSVIGVVALFGIPAAVKLVVASKLAEFRLDKTVSEDGGLGTSFAADKLRNDRHNYSAAGQRFYGWYKLVSIGQLLCCLGAAVWLALEV